jgi:hypothetical protein
VVRFGLHPRSSMFLAHRPRRRRSLVLAWLARSGRLCLDRFGCRHRRTAEGTDTPIYCPCDGSIGLNGVMRGLRYSNDYMRHARTPDPVIYLGRTRRRLH